MPQVILRKVLYVSVLYFAPVRFMSLLAESGGSLASCASMNRS